MALQVLRGQDAQGQPANLPVGGIAWQYSTPLAANGTISSGWVDASLFNSMLYVIKADQPSAVNGVSIEFSMDQTTVMAGGLSRQYIASPKQLQVAVQIKCNYVRLTYTNGATAQNSVYLEMRLGTETMQNTMSSIFQPVTDTNMGSVTVSVEQAPNSVTGDYSVIAEQSGGKRVYVVNQPSAVTSVAVNNLPATQPISGTVAVSNFPTSQAVTVTNSVEIANDSGNPLPVSGTVTVSNPVSTVAVNNFPSTQPVSASALPLPAGASTSALQTTGNTSLASILTGIGTPGDATITDPTLSATVVALLKGLLQETQAPATTGTMQPLSIAANASVTIAANANRKGVIISSTSGTLYVGVGYTPTANNWTYRIVTNGINEIRHLESTLAITIFATAASTGTATLTV